MRGWLGMLPGGLKGGWGKRVLGGCWRGRGELMRNVALVVVVGKVELDG
jgi:hypothetical protein